MPDLLGKVMTSELRALQASLLAAKTICRRCEHTYSSNYHRMVCVVEREYDPYPRPWDRRTRGRA